MSRPTMLNGVKVRMSKVYAFRRPVEGDLDLEGKQVESNHYVLVRIKDCVHRFVEKRNTICYLPDEKPIAPMAMPLSYSMTCAGRGPAKKQSSYMGRWVFNSETRKQEFAYEWYRMPYYEGHDARVYAGSDCRTVESWTNLCKRRGYTIAGVPKEKTT